MEVSAAMEQEGGSQCRLVDLKFPAELAIRTTGLQIGGAGFV